MWNDSWSKAANALGACLLLPLPHYRTHLGRAQPVCQLDVTSPSSLLHPRVPGNSILYMHGGNMALLVYCKVASMSTSRNKQARLVA